MPDTNLKIGLRPLTDEQLKAVIEFRRTMEEEVIPEIERTLAMREEAWRRLTSDFIMTDGREYHPSSGRRSPRLAYDSPVLLPELHEFKEDDELDRQRSLLRRDG